MSLRCSVRAAFFPMLAGSFALLGCNGGPLPMPEGCDQWIEPSDDDQAQVQEALIQAEDDPVVCFAAGTYTFSRQLTLNADGATLRGEGMDEDEGTVFDFTDQKSGANGISITGDGVTVEMLRVENTQGDGIRADQVEDITFREVAVIWPAASEDNGAYGLYPVRSNGVTIQNSFVTGARDAGIYAGQSTEILMEGNEVVGNVLAIEVENSHDAVVRDNHMHGNTGGLLIVDLPGLEAEDGARTNAYDNLIEDNNLENFGEPGTLVAQLPPGLGVLVLATDHHEVHHNVVQGNIGAGIVVISYLEALFGEYDDDDYDIYPQGNFVHDNMLADNATDPADLIRVVTEAADPAPDIIWDGCVDPAEDPDDDSLRNCIVDNGSVDYLNTATCDSSLPTTDAKSVTCEHDSLPDDLPFD